MAKVKPSNIAIPQLISFNVDRTKPPIIVIVSSKLFVTEWTNIASVYQSTSSNSPKKGKYVPGKTTSFSNLGSI